MYEKFKNFLKKLFMKELTKEELKALMENSSNSDVRKWLKEIDVDYNSTEKLCKNLTDITLKEEKSFIAVAKMADSVYCFQKGKSKKEFLRVMHLKKNLFKEGESAEESAKKFFRNKHFSRNPKKILHNSLVAFYVACYEKNHNYAKKSFLELIEGNKTGTEENLNQLNKLKKLEELKFKKIRKIVKKGGKS
jgi:hypothetical protein